MDTLKQCTKCKEEKPATLEYFVGDKRRKSGLGSWCRKCCAEYDRQRAAKNPEYAARKRERTRARRARRLAETPEAVREEERLKSAQNRAMNPEKVREQHRTSVARRRVENPDRLRELGRASRVRRRARNPEKAREQERIRGVQYRAKNPEKVREQGRLKEERRLARKRGLPHTLTKAEWQYAVDWWGGCAYCGADLPAGELTLDHVIPLVSPDCPGTTAENIIPACIKCNRIKNRFSVEQFLERNFGQDHAASRLAIIADFFNTLPDDD